MTYPTVRGLRRNRLTSMGAVTVRQARPLLAIAPHGVGDAFLAVLAASLLHTKPVLAALDPKGSEILFGARELAYFLSTSHTPLGNPVWCGASGTPLGRQ